MRHLAFTILMLVLMLPLRGSHVLAAPTMPYIERFDIEAYVERNDSCFITIMFTLVVPPEYGGEVSAVEIPLLERQDIPPREGDITNWTTGQNIRLKWAESMYLSHIMVISFNEPVPPGGKVEVRISLSASKGVFVHEVPYNPEGRVFYYRFYQPNVSLALEKSLLRVYLPPNSILRQFPRYRQLFNPMPFQISDEITLGRASIIWDLSTPEVMESERTVFYCTYSLEEATGSLGANTSQPGPFIPKISFIALIASNVVSGLLAFTVSWFLFKRKIVGSRPTTISSIDLAKQTLDEKDLKKIEGIINQLTYEELEILKLLAKNGGSMKQREIPSNVGFSKSKTSRMLKRMENMGLITRTSVGRTKQVNLSPAFMAYFLSRIQKVEGGSKQELE